MTQSLQLPAPKTSGALHGQDALVTTLARALRYEDGVDEVELAYEGGARNHARFAHSAMTQVSTERGAKVSVRVRVGTRVGYARCGGADEPTLRRAVRHARELADASPADTTPGVFPAPRPVKQMSAAAFDEETAALRTDDKLARLGAAFERARQEGATLAGHFHTAALEHCVVSTAGVRCYHAGTRADVATIAQLASANAIAPSGFAGALHRAVGRIDLGGLAETAIGGALRGRAPVTVPLGEYTVVLGPAAVAELVEWLSLASLCARSVEDGSSFAADGFGRRVTGPLISLYDEGESELPEALPQPFDIEGMPARRLPLLDRGVVVGVTHDSRSATRLGLPSTGHASEDALSGDRLGVPTHLFLEGGDDTEDELIAQVERGLYVTRFHYVCGTLDPRRGSMTGATRDGLRLIEDGRVTRGCTDLRWNVSVLRAFAEVEGASRARTTLPAFFGGGAVVAPALLVRRWRFDAYAGTP